MKQFKFINLFIVLGISFILILTVFGYENKIPKESKESKESNKVSTNRSFYFTNEDYFDSIEDSIVKDTIKSFWRDYTEGDLDSARDYVILPAKDKIEFQNEIQKEVLNRTEINYKGETVKENGENIYKKVKLEIILPDLEALYPSYIINTNEKLKELKENTDYDKLETARRIFKEKLGDLEEKKIISNKNFVLKKVNDEWKIKEADILDIKVPDISVKAIEQFNNIDDIISNNFSEVGRAKHNMRDKIEMELSENNQDEKNILKTLIKYPDERKLYPEYIQDIKNTFIDVRGELKGNVLKRTLSSGYSNALEDIGFINFESESSITFCSDELEYQLNKKPYIDINSFDYLEEGKKLYEFVQYFDEYEVLLKYLLDETNEGYIENLLYFDSKINGKEFELRLTYPNPDKMKEIHLKNFGVTLDLDEDKIKEIVNVVFKEMCKNLEKGNDDILTRVYYRNKVILDDNNFKCKKAMEYPEIKLPFFE